jgi:ABC-2 type transport system ATP-binding protein
MKKIERKHRIIHMLDIFGLSEVGHKRIGEYSKGMRQKLALARALLHMPPVLLLDEPTSAMDPESAKLVRDSISKLRSQERAILICTHNLMEAEELSDRIAIIWRGKIIASGSPQELKLNFLGAPEFEVQFRDSLNGMTPEFPAGIKLTASGDTWIRIRSDSPHELNPVVMKKLVAGGLGVVSFQEVPRSLEQVYLKAVSDAVNKGGVNA